MFSLRFMFLFFTLLRTFLGCGRFAFRMMVLFLLPLFIGRSSTATSLFALGQRTNGDARLQRDFLDGRLLLVDAREQVIVELLAAAITELFATLACLKEREPFIIQSLRIGSK